MSKSKKIRPSFSSGRRFAIAINVMVSILAATAVLVLANYVGIRNFKRMHLSAVNRFDLSPLSRQLTASLTNALQVTVFFHEQTDTDHALYTYTTSLLREYQAINTNIVVEAVDYMRDPGTAELIKRKYQLTVPGHHNMVIFDANDKVRIVQQDELSDYAAAGYEGGTNLVFKRTAYKGEQLFTSAILSLSEPFSPMACLLQGHGEHDPEGTDPNAGYSRFAILLEQNNITPTKLWLSGTNQIPDSCSLLIIAGSRTTIHEQEVRKIEEYLEQGGRLLALLPSNTLTGLEPLLHHWGVIIGDHFAIDTPNSINGPMHMSVTNFAEHRVVLPLIDSQLYLFGPRPIGRMEMGTRQADAPQVEVLFRTGPEGRIVSTDSRGQTTVSDGMSAIPLAVAVEKGAIPGVSASHGTTRMVVVGDSLFLGNNGITSFSNSEFANLAINWLLDRSFLVDIGPRPVREYQLSMTQSNKETATWILLAGMPGGFLLLGLLVWVTRRK